MLRANTELPSPQRCRSQRQIDASSHTAIRMLLSRLKLVCRMAAVHLGSVSVVHLQTKKTASGDLISSQKHTIPS